MMTVATTRRAATVALMALAGFMSLGVGVAVADEVQVDGSYATLAACQADGPEVQIAENNDAYSGWECRQGDDGLYYLYLTS